MAYVANKSNMDLNGQIYAKGERIPDSEVAQFPPARFAQLLRTGLVYEVVDAPKPASKPAAELVIDEVVIDDENIALILDDPLEEE